MVLRGDYEPGTTYGVGDAVRYTDGVFYHMLKAAPAGTPPTDTLYWNRMSQDQAEVSQKILDMEKQIPAEPTDGLKASDVMNNLTTTTKGKVLDARQGKALKKLIDELTARVAALEPKAGGD